jgi:acyl-CoA thioester hydrolase
MKIRIYYEDTDAAGIVYYANYLKLCERARSEPFFSRGISPQSEEGYFVVRHIEADYLHPARLGELVEVRTSVAEKRGASLVLLQEIVRDGERLFVMRVKLVFLKGGRPARIPPAVQSLVESWGKTES